MDILTLIGLSILLAFLWESGIIGVFVFACIVVFVWEKFNVIILIIFGLSVLGLILKYVFQNSAVNNVPKSVKEQELEDNLKKVREWSRRSKC